MANTAHLANLANQAHHTKWFDFYSREGVYAYEVGVCVVRMHYYFLHKKFESRSANAKANAKAKEQVRAGQAHYSVNGIVYATGAFC